MDDKVKISSGYDQIAERYLDWSVNRPSPRLKQLEALLQHLDPSASVLELGCGPGTPVLEILTQRVAKVTGNDISARFIELSRERCPGATLVQGDMASLRFDLGTFDAVVGFYTFQHLPHEEHAAVLSNIYDWLKRGGYLLMNFALGEEKGEVRHMFFGAEMYTTSSVEEVYIRLLENAQFEVVEHEVLREGDIRDLKDRDDAPRFLWVLARRSDSGEDV